MAGDVLMKTPIPMRLPLSHRKVALRIALIYSLVGGIWIVFSDELLAMLVEDPLIITRYSTYKGWFYVAATAVMLFHLIKQATRELQQSEAVLRDLAQSLATITGTQFFQQLVLLLSRILKVDYVLIGTLDPEHTGVVHTLAVSSQGNLQGNGAFLLNSLPCENILDKTISYQADMVFQFNLDNNLLKDRKITSSLAVPLIDSTDQVCGLLLAMHSQPLEKPELAQTLMNILVQRAAAEIERKLTDDQLKYKASHDALTDLPNRFLFNEQLDLALETSVLHRLMTAVIYVDLDNFKNINDTMGHVTGDSVLVHVSSTLASCVGEQGMISRMGGDEFTVILPGAPDTTHVEQLAHTILNSISRPIVLDDYEYNITASIGIAVYPQDGRDGETLLRNADTALYSAKEKGKNNFQFYTSAMNDQIKEHLAIEKDLRQAILGKEFVVYYQPQIQTLTSQLTGMEALVRWQHPEKGLLYPGQFIRVAEETGLIKPIGEWVLYTACAQNKSWQSMGVKPFRVSVNLSPYQFLQHDLVETVQKVLKETSLEGKWLELEITEGMAMQDVERTITTLRELQQLGISIAIDDFGTGYSSLSYLKQFPINRLKIDQSFLRVTNSQSDNRAIVKTIIVLGKNLKLGVIAEGVETEEQHLFLQECECEEVQGYLFGKPVSAEDTLKLLQPYAFVE